MPWKVNDVMEQRFQLISRWKESQESISDLARRFEVSRKTVCKWLDRYEEEGAAGLCERSRRPLVQAARIPEQVQEWILDLRHAHPTWGPLKLRQWLTRKRATRPGLRRVRSA